MPGDVETFKSSVAGICPFCQKKFEAGEDAHGSPGLLHELPICKEFDELGPAEYLKAVRLKYSS